MKNEKLNEFTTVVQILVSRLTDAERRADRLNEANLLLLEEKAALQRTNTELRNRNFGLEEENRRLFNDRCNKYDYERMRRDLEHKCNYIKQLEAERNALRMKDPNTLGTLDALKKDPEFLEHIKRGSKIYAIKMVRDRTQWGLKEAKDYVEAEWNNLFDLVKSSNEPVPIP